MRPRAADVCPPDRRRMVAYAVGAQRRDGHRLERGRLFLGGQCLFRSRAPGVPGFATRVSARRARTALIPSSPATLQPDPFGRNYPGVPPLKPTPALRPFDASYQCSSDVSFALAVAPSSFSVIGLAIIRFNRIEGYCAASARRGGVSDAVPAEDFWRGSAAAE